MEARRADEQAGGIDVDKTFQAEQEVQQSFE